MQNNFLNNKKNYIPNNRVRSHYQIKYNSDSKRVDINKLLNRIKIKEKKTQTKKIILACISVMFVFVFGMFINIFS